MKSKNFMSALVFMSLSSVYPKEKEGQKAQKHFVGSFYSSKPVYLLWWLILCKQILLFSQPP